MKCPFCKHPATQVMDTRENDEGDSIRRRRRCLSCDKRFTTYEMVELRMPQVVKQNGTRSEFDEEKLRTSFTRALHKRPVPTELVDAAIDHVTQKIFEFGEREIGSRQIGEMVMRELLKLDKVAYIRFASVYKSFQDVGDFTEAVEAVRKITRKTAQTAGRLMIAAQDSQWMARALQLAQRGLYTTGTNPRVGCVLVKDCAVAGEGWHERAGEPHAEVHALRAAGEAARGATAYVTLEPCSHHGRTPPCADALIDAGVARVVVAVQDPNPQVAGQGIARLRAAGMAVECGLMETAARELNIGFFKRMTHGMPWLRSKIAASLDGRTALSNGESQWITGAEARQDVQHWRARSCAVFTGIGTVLADDPQLNVRGIETTRQPLRVVVDSYLRMPPTSRILQPLPSPASGRGVGGEGRVWIYTATQDAHKIAALEQAGARVTVLADANGRVDLPATMRDLAASGCNEVLTEAGSALNGALLQAGLVDELVFYLAPQLLGDAARGLAALGELTSLDQRVKLEWQDVRHVGEDLRIVARVKK